ncbi:O-acyltransferase [Bacteroidia bacterium]|nr:O-acyltransferase [Bacteroidia bacterium]
MIFNSNTFFFFFLLVFLLCLLINNATIFDEKRRVQLRNGILLIASYYFYAFLKWEFVFLLLATTAVNYVCSLKIDSKKKAGQLFFAKLWMWIAVAFSIGLLVYFKYVNFFIDSIQEAFSMLGIGLKMNFIQIALPVGISFFTFQALTYTLDVYKGKIEVRKSFMDVALFVSFFPTILSGPIERARNLMPQLEQASKISWKNVITGGKLFLWGLFKKVVIADRLANYINIVYMGSITDHSSITLIITAVLYSFQIYADFSGYSDMAIGIGKILGFDLMKNFNYPYFSTSIKEFWKRWHISLTSWFTEYVYIPLGGNRVKQSRWILNISTVFLLSGLWHGANWSFIFWGILHAVYYLVEFYYKKSELYIKNLFRKKYVKLNQLFSMVIVFILVTIAWIYFRIENIGKASDLITYFFSGKKEFYWGMSSFTTGMTIFLLFLFLILDWIKYKNIKFNSIINAAGYAFLLALILLVGVSDVGFVYFQF